MFKRKSEKAFRDEVEHYLERDISKLNPGMILQVSGQLASSVNIYYDNDSALIDSNLAYAAIHQRGGQIYSFILINQNS